MNSWRKYQHQISPEISPLKIPNKSLTEFNKSKPNVILIYHDLIDESGSFKNYQVLADKQARLVFL